MNRFDSIKSNLRIIIAIAIIVLPLFLVWHIELSTIFKTTVSNDTVEIIHLNNGFQRFNASQVYHTLMYLTLGMSWLASFIIIKGEISG